MQIITLTEEETLQWEDGGHEGDAFRRATRARAIEISAETGWPIEIYSWDGIVLDAIPADDK